MTTLLAVPSNTSARTYSRPACSRTLNAARLVARRIVGSTLTYWFVATTTLFVMAVLPQNTGAAGPLPSGRTRSPCAGLVLARKPAVPFVHTCRLMGKLLKLVIAVSYMPLVAFTTRANKTKETSPSVPANGCVQTVPQVP